MKTNVELPVVRECLVSQCAYNDERVCHALAITVGDGIHPACDTFLPSGEHVHDRSRVAGVGACKVSACRYNHELSCTADDIGVGYHGSHADCMTFSPR